MDTGDLAALEPLDDDFCCDTDELPMHLTRLVNADIQLVLV